MNKAKVKVISDGYTFAKGKSRSKGGSDESSEGPAIKRPKLTSEERSREIKLMQENLKTLNSRLGFKKQQLEKERCISNYKQCDIISAEMMEVRKERASVDKQLTALVKKEAKSSWYHKKGPRNKNNVDGESKRKQIQDNQPSLPSLLKKSSSCSSTCSTDDTVILSDSSVENEKDPKRSCAETPVAGSGEKQIFCQVPPMMVTDQAEETQNM